MNNYIKEQIEEFLDNIEIYQCCDHRQQIKDKLIPILTQCWKKAQQAGYNKGVELAETLAENARQEERKKIIKWAEKILKDEGISNGYYNAMNDLISYLNIK